MICGIGDADLVGASDGPTAQPTDAALIGGQVLDEQESRRLRPGQHRHVRPRMLATGPGMAACAAWAGAIGDEVGGLYLAIDLDVLDGSSGWALPMPEPDGLSLDVAVRAVEALAAGRAPVVGIGITAANLAHGDGPATVEAIARLVDAGLA